MEAITPVSNAEETSQTTEHLAMQHQPFFRKWGGLVILSLALAIIIIDTTLLNVSLKTIINDLDTDLKSMQWVITIYSLILAAFTITGGRLGDLFGRKKMFLMGAVIFALGSFLASVSKNIGMMIAGEAIIEGIGAAMMMPATASLLITNFKGRDRSIAFGVWGGIAAASSAIGPILGGWLTTNYSWRWGFRINIFVVAIVLLGSFLIKENRDANGKNKVDFVGIVLSSLGLLSMVFGFIQASTYGWLKAKESLVVLHHTISFGSLSATPVFVVLGILILVGLIFFERWYETRGHTPLISLSLFRNRQFVSGASTMAVLALGQAGLFFTIPVFLQAVRHLDALHTGLTLLPMSLALLVGAPLSAFLIKFIRPKYLIQIGMSLSVLAFIILRQTLSVDSTAWDLAPGFIVFGFGMGLIMAQVSNLTLSAVSHEEAGEASGVNNTLRMVGQTLGSAILGAILLSALITNVNKGIDDSRVIPQEMKQNLQSGLSSHISDISFEGVGSAAPSLPKKIGDEISTITDEATVKANKTVMVYGLLFVLAGLLVSTRLPNIKDAHADSGEAEKENTMPEEMPEKTEEIVMTEEVKNEHQERTVEPAAIAMVAASAATAAEIEEEIKRDDEPKNRKWWIIGLILLLLIGALIAYALKHKKSDTETENNSRPEIVQTGENNQSQTNTNSSNEATRPEETAPIVGGVMNDVDVDSSETSPNSTPSNSPAAPETGISQSAHTNNNLQFAFNMPSDWKVVKDSDGEVVFKAPNGLYNVQSYSAPNSDWDSLRAFLEQQPGVSNVRRVMFGSRDLFQFDSNSSYQSGYAFLENGRLYYILGMGSERTPLVDIKTF